MPIADLGDINLHYREDGTPTGAPVVFSNALGTDLRIWDQVVARLPDGLRIIRYDTRGHGLSDCPPGPYAMGALVRDAERLLDQLQVKDCVFIGLSLGGMIGQGLAVKRLDQVRALVLSNTAAKIGQPSLWQERIETVKAGGIEALTEQTMQRWFTKPYRNSADCAQWRHMMERQPLEGYISCCAAIAGTDFYTPTSGLRLPTLGIAGSDDGSTPADLVRETVDLVPGSRFELIRKSGHIPCAERPDDYAGVLTRFLQAIGHIEAAAIN